MSELSNARRTIDKAEQALRHVERYFSSKDEMNAAAHISERVMISPLHAEIQSVLQGITTFQSTYPADDG